jgi:hypothetical protein
LKGCLRWREHLDLDMSYPPNPSKSAPIRSPSGFPLSGRTNDAAGPETSLIYSEKVVTFMSTLEDTNVDIDNT